MVLNGHRLARPRNGRKWFRSRKAKNSGDNVKGAKFHLPDEPSSKIRADTFETGTITTEEDANSPLNKSSFVSRNKKIRASRSQQQPQNVKFAAPQEKSATDQNQKQDTSDINHSPSSTTAQPKKHASTAKKSSRKHKTKKNSDRKHMIKKNCDTVAIVFDENRLEGQIMVGSLSKSGSNVVVVLNKFDTELASSLMKMKHVSVSFVDTTDSHKVAAAIEGSDRAVMITAYWEKLNPDEEVRALALVEACEINGISCLTLGTFEDTAHLRHSGLPSQIQAGPKGTIEPKFRGMKTLRRAARKSHVRVSHMLTSYLDYEHSKASICLISGGRGRPLNIISSDLDKPFTSRSKRISKYFRKILKLLKKHKVIINLIFSSMMIVTMWTLLQQNYHKVKKQGQLQASDDCMDVPLQMGFSDIINSGMTRMACFQVVSYKTFNDIRTYAMVAWMVVISMAYWWWTAVGH